MTDKPVVGSSKEQLRKLALDNAGLRDLLHIWLHRFGSTDELSIVTRHKLGNIPTADETGPVACPDWGQRHNFLQGRCSCGESEYPSVHVIAVPWCQCCAARVPVDHVCACEATSEKAFVQLCAPHGKDWLTCPECAKAAVNGASNVAR